MYFSSTLKSPKWRRVYSPDTCSSQGLYHGKNGFVSATKLGTTNKFFVAATKNFAAATKRFVDRTKHFVVVTKCFCYPHILTNDFFSITKPFFPWWWFTRWSFPISRQCFQKAMPVLFGNTDGMILSCRWINSLQSLHNCKHSGTWILKESETTRNRTADKAARSQLYSNPTQTCASKNRGVVPHKN